MSFVRFVEIGRVALITYGPEKDKICTIIDVIDNNRVLVDGPLSGVKRQEINIKRIQLTDITMKCKLNSSQKCAQQQCPSRAVPAERVAGERAALSPPSARAGASSECVGGARPRRTPSCAHRRMGAARMYHRRRCRASQPRLAARVPAAPPLVVSRSGAHARPLPPATPQDAQGVVD